ncbi:MAG: hypothetical protein ABI142_09335, partial [Bryocella sp.]
HALAMKNWAESKRLDPTRAVLDAEMGKAWLHIKNDPQHALVAFREGVKNDAQNEDVYDGLDKAMSLTGVSAKERAAALALYPSASTMPPNLVYQLALTQAEAGQYDQALALFQGRFFPSAESGVSADQVQFEIRLMQAQFEASSGRCSAVEEFLKAEHPGLVLNGTVSRSYLQMSAIAKSCRNLPLSKQLLQKAAGSTAAGDAAWAIKAQTLLGNRDVAQQQKTLKAALDAAERMTLTSAYTGWWWYNAGSLRAALNQNAEAQVDFRKAILFPDSMMSHHLSRVAMAESSKSHASATAVGARP